MFKILCKLGIHRPLKKIQCLFIDKVSGKEVWLCTCPCGKKWMNDSLCGWGGLKVERNYEGTNN